MMFAKVDYRHPRIDHPIHHGWVVSIRGASDLFTYNEKYAFARNAASLRDFFRHQEECIKGHWRDSLTSSVCLLAKIRESSFADTLGKVESERITGMIALLPIYINKNGGYMPQTNCTVLAEVESDTWPVDGKTESPRYLQWPGGTHWYCKVGIDDVVVDDERKWDTKDEAEAAYKMWSSRSKAEGK